MPDPDLLFRYGGEKYASSNSAVEVAYTEIYFTDTLWPEFDENVLGRAIGWFSDRPGSDGSHDSER
jgi:undecaprenyl diphosphate synthase